MARFAAAMLCVSLATAGAAHAQSPFAGEFALLSAAVFEKDRALGEINFETRDRAYQLTPHAGFTQGASGAQAGATLSLGDKVAGRLGGLGVTDGARFGDRGRWYLFAAASGRSVGLNMLRGPEGGFQRAGWTMDGTSALVSDAQAGVGWRRGPVQASVGYLRREIKPLGGAPLGLDMEEDDLVAVSFSVKQR